MAEILRVWLTERLQQPIKWEAEEFGHMMKDGQVIAGLLLSYHVINEEKYLLIRGGEAIQDIQRNWMYISEWLHTIDIFLNNTDIGNVMQGQGSTLLRLFYKLFLHLDRRDRTNFIKLERKMVSNLVKKTENRFKVVKVDEEDESVVEELSKPLLNEKHFIEWQRKKAEKVKDTYDYIRYKHKKMVEKLEESKIPCRHDAPKTSKLQQKNKIEMAKFATRYPCHFKNYTYEELLELEVQANERKTSLVGTEWAKNYIDNLHSKLNDKSDSEEFQKQISNVISTTIWDRSINDEEANVDLQLAKKVMKLSQFEKQMCTQILETKQQARNLTKNRIQADKEYNEQREQQFNEFLDNIKDQINLEFAEIEFEKQRQNDLHKKLFGEKTKRKRQHYYEICYDTVLALTDYASKYAFFKKLLDDDIPEHFIQEWKKLFFRQQPIFDILDHIEDLLKEPNAEEEEIPEEVEINVNIFEKNRQETMNDEEFKEYHNYIGPWLLEKLIPNYDTDAGERRIEYLGNRVLGHVVYTLLNIKYPYPPTKTPVDLPDFPVRALVRGLPDNVITISMQALLKYRNIHVARVENAINHCLKTFKQEMVGCTDIDLSYDKFINAASDDNKDFVKALKNNDEPSNKAVISAKEEKLSANTKQTQTPKTIPEEEIKLSTAAELGRYAYEALFHGDSLTDYLLSAMIAEYLKAQNDIKGFVIINYPNSYREAQILEETFSGCEPPDEESLMEDSDDIYLEESIIKHRKTLNDQFKFVRVSKLVNDPHKPKYVKPFESYFTCYLRMKPTDDILQEKVIWDLTEDNSELIDRFYSALGMNYSMYYEYVEKNLLAQICWYIIGDFSIPLHASDDLFGENVLSHLDFPSSDEKTTKSKTIKPEVKSSNAAFDKMLKKLSKSKSISSFENAMAADDDEAPDSSIQIRSKSTIVQGEEIEILPGDEEWVYGESSIPEGIGIAVASYWECLEKTYIQDIEELFFAKRLVINSLVPYTHFIKDKMSQIITQSSKKQEYVRSFIDSYNDFEDDWRYHNIAKSEWHCRVQQLKTDLYKICDEKKIFCEQQLQGIINDNWTIEELSTLVNTYLSCMQTELNRFFLSYQVMHDFYFTMIKGLPPTDRLDSKEITKINRESEVESAGRKPTEDKTFKQLRLAYLEMQSKNIDIDIYNNPFNSVLENIVKSAVKIITDTNDSYKSIISKEYVDVGKMTIPQKKKDIQDENQEISREEVLKNNMIKCIQEWTMGVNGEMFRTNLRLLALQYQCYHDMELFNNHLHKTLNSIRDFINEYYLNEIQSADWLCKYINIAIEDGRKIPESLILVQDTLKIDPNLLQFPPIPKRSMSVLDKPLKNMDFRMSQLAKLRSLFKICGPTGLALQRKFIYVIEDFIVHGAGSCNGPLFPDAWSRVDINKIPKLVYNMFGDTVYIDWKEFLIYALNLPFPTLDDLLELRKNFRCVDVDSTECITRDKFFEQKLWFEDEYDHLSSRAQLRLHLIKHFIFELFEVSQDIMCYSSFLLMFCRNNDPLEGFATAISMVVGKKTCFKESECIEIICKFIEDKRYKEACLACATECAVKFIDALFDRVMDICVGTTFSEVEYDPLEEVKKGKGKKDPKSKKDTAHSARSLKSKNNNILQAKSQSESNVNTTFICEPCQDDVKPEQLPEPVVEEEDLRSESLQADPNLIYAVPQFVIWNILRICLPWHFDLVPEVKATPYVEKIQDVLSRLEEDTDDGTIYLAKFLADPFVCKLLHKVNRFTILNMQELLENYYP